jgi:DNA-binding transcriptional MerR regulator
MPVMSKPALAAPFGGNFNKPAALMTCFALLSIYAMYPGRETRADPRRYRLPARCLPGLSGPCHGFRMPIDTLKVAKRLRDAGFTEPQAEAVIAAVQEGTESADLATKQDLKAEIADLRSELRQTELRLEARIEAIKSDILKRVFGLPRYPRSEHRGDRRRHVRGGEAGRTLRPALASLILPRAKAREDQAARLLRFVRNDASNCCHCEEPPGRRHAPPEDRLRDKAISI